MVWHHQGVRKFGVVAVACRGSGKPSERTELPPKDSFEGAVRGIPGGDGWLNKTSGQIFDKVGALLLVKGLSQDEAISVLDNLYWAAAENYK